ncbi:MAG: hypothetical protein NC898_04290 [Candidatus Omnitrophica bacterium]|nr:hypothetical protein [Candidatus Omnitrophota bacterium]MCM8793666.1 hypothetical protein [Candidatus Omnitrophota bacterium]
MRGKLRKRKRNFFILFFIILGLSLFLSAQQNKLSEEIKASLQKALGNKLNLSLSFGEIHHWWGRRLSVEDLLVSDKDKNFLLGAKKAYFSFSLGDILFKNDKIVRSFQMKMEDVSLSLKGFRLPLQITAMQVNLDNGYLELKNLRGILGKDLPFELEATLGRLTESFPLIHLRCQFFRKFESKPYFFFIPAVISLRGDWEKVFLEGFAEEDKPAFRIEGTILPYEGRFNLAIFSDLNKEGSPLQIEGDYQKKKKSIKIKFDHLPFLDNELISQIFIEGEYAAQEKAIVGEFYSSGTVWNYFPFPEFEGKYRFKDGVLSIDNFNWAEAISFSGEINFLNKISGKISLIINNLNLLYFAHIYYPDWKAWGRVSGKALLEINEGNLLAKGDIEFTEGELGPFKFKGGRIRFNGENNRFQLSDTRIYQDNGYFELSGEVDLRHLGKSDFGKNLVLIPYPEKINWQGWSIIQKEPSGIISLNKKIDEKLSLQFNAYKQDYTELLREKRDEFGLEYRLEEDRSLKLRLKENEEILGFERKIKF